VLTPDLRAKSSSFTSAAIFAFVQFSSNIVGAFVLLMCRFFTATFEPDSSSKKTSW
jgi:hypothetical protein